MKFDSVLHSIEPVPALGVADWCLAESLAWIAERNLDSVGRVFALRLAWDDAGEKEDLGVGVGTGAAWTASREGIDGWRAALRLLKAGLANNEALNACGRKLGDDPSLRRPMVRQLFRDGKFDKYGDLVVGRDRWSDILVSRQAVLHLWEPNGAVSLVAEAPPRGRRPIYDWHGLMGEFTRIADEDGLLEEWPVLADAERWAAKWFEDRGGKCPGEASIRQHLSPAYAAKRDHNRAKAGK